MKKLLRLLALAIAMPCASLFAQCPAGYSTAALNWDNLDFLVQDATYISASQAQTQYFAFGKNRLTITHNYASASTGGDNATHTGESGSYGVGSDVQFLGNGTVTVTFQAAVQNVKFSLYDIDYNQVITVTAANGSAQTVTMTRVTTNQLTVAGSGTTSASATGPATTALANTSADGAINVDIAGPVTSFTITATLTGTKTNGNAASQEDGSFWLSDISACSNSASFPTSYYAISQPYTGQPGYLLAALDDTVLMVNPANGVSKVLFTDPTGNNINSLAYDPYSRFVYYTYSLTGTNGAVNANDRSIQKYDVSTGVISTVVSNVNTLGIPTYTSGVESGGAAFYDGALYIGIEGMTGDESKIWRIDFDASFNPIAPARQIFTMPTDFHDWSDFAISNGVLYDFDGKSSNSSNYEGITTISLQTGATIADYNFATLGFVPRQVSMDWTEKLYNTGTAATTSTGTIVPYANGAITVAQQYTITKNGLSPSGSWGDAGEAFRPDADFGDAPSSYDPVALSPALHEIISTLRFGAGTDDEFAKKTSALANGDTDDGMPFVAIVNQGGNYLANVNVFNNTGSNATVCAWVDFNNDGVFTASEGISVTVPSSASLQNVDLFWPNPTNTLPPHSYTFFRVRITSASNGMTTANPTGYFSNGEVEDYRVQVNSTVLPVDLVRFEAKKAPGGKAQLTWEIADELAGAFYVLERSVDNRNWVALHEQGGMGQRNKAVYDHTDASPVTGLNYYRLKISKPSKAFKYSSVRTLDFGSQLQVLLAPNPVRGNAKIQVAVSAGGVAQLGLADAGGRWLYQKEVKILAGHHSFPMPLAGSLPPGSYMLQLWFEGQRISQRFTVVR